MPPGWIEHPTSPLPRARSTPELRRRTRSAPYAIGVNVAQDDEKDASEHGAARHDRLVSRQSVA